MDRAKFFKAEIKIFAASVPLDKYSSADYLSYDWEHAAYDVVPIIEQDCNLFLDAGYSISTLEHELQQLIETRMMELGRKELYNRCPIEGEP